MAYQTLPATGIKTYKEGNSDFASDITPDVPFRKLYAIGGASVVFIDTDGNTVTVLAADYAAINNQAIYVKTIKAATDCVTLYASR